MLNNKQARILYSFWDFSQALSALTFLLEEFSPEESYNSIELRKFRCFETTLIISMARPFEKTRSGTTLSLKNLGIKFSDSENFLVNRVFCLRKKVIAHSDEDEMHFYIEAHDLGMEGIDFRLPDVRFDESLFLKYEELEQLEIILRKLKNAITEHVFRLIQEYPDLIKMYKKPKSWDSKQEKSDKSNQKTN